jgi:hypothetical protein
MCMNNGWHICSCITVANNQFLDELTESGSKLYLPKLKLSLKPIISIIGLQILCNKKANSIITIGFQVFCTEIILNCTS